jgi:hypothetical protein
MLPLPLITPSKPEVDPKGWRPRCTPARGRSSVRVAVIGPALVHSGYPATNHRGESAIRLTRARPKIAR